MLFPFQGQMVKEKKLFCELQKFANLQKNSPGLYPVARDLVLSVFQEQKPIFEEAHKAKAFELVKKSLPLLETSFAFLHGSLNPDLRQVAQRCRSGLQFLIEEFKGEENFEELKPILICPPVKCVEEYIKNTKDIPPEYSTVIPQDLSAIPLSHFWWFDDDDE